MLPTFARDFEYTYEGQTITYTVIDEEAKTCSTRKGTVSSSFQGNKISGSVIIPEIAVDEDGVEYSVKELGEYAFSKNTSLVSIVLPMGLTSIANKAFYQCTGLSSIKFPDSLESIGEEAFRECSALTSVKLPSSVIKIDRLAFCRCSSLTFVELPKSLKTIGTAIFSSCTSLTSIDIPSSVTSIETEAFYNCPLTVLSLPSSIQKLGGDVVNVAEYVICNFTNCTKSGTPFKVKKKVMVREGSNLPILSSSPVYTFPNTDYIIENGTMYSLDKTKIYSVMNLDSDVYTIDSCVKEIGANAFAECGDFTTINSNNFPAPSFPESAFSELYETVIVNVPMNIYGDYISKGSNWNLFANLKGIDPNESNETVADGDLLYRYINDNQVEVINSDTYKEMESIVIPESLSILIEEATDDIPAVYKDVEVVGIAEFAFDGCELLSEIVIPESVVRIGDGAFRNCSSLSSIKLPEAITRIGGATFENCSSLTIMPSSPNLEEIGSGAFYNCNSIASVELPEGVKIIGVSAFDGCSNLSSVSFGNSLTQIGAYAFNSTILTEVDLESQNELEIRSNAFQGHESLKTVNLRNGVVTVEDHAFADCKKLTSVSVSEDLKKIGKRAFNCLNAGLTTLNLPKTGKLTHIGDSAFNALRVRQLDLPDSLTYIGDDAFGNARMITSITMPANRNLKVGKRAFIHAQRLATLNFPETIKEIGDSCFMDNILPEVHVKADNIGNRAFMESNKLVTLQLTGDGDMGESAFAELPELETATINHATVGLNAFKNASKLKTVNLDLGLRIIKDEAMQGTAVDSLSFASGPVVDPIIEIGSDIVSNKLRYLSLGNRVKTLKPSNKYNAGYINAHIYGLMLKDDEDAYMNLGESVESIGDNAIYVVNAHVSLTIPESLKEFGKCSVYVDSIIVAYSSDPLVFKLGVVESSLWGTRDQVIRANYAFIDRELQRDGDDRWKIITPYNYNSNSTLIIGNNPELSMDIQRNILDSFANTHIGAGVKKITSMYANNVVFSEGIEEIDFLSVSPTSGTLRLPTSLKLVNSLSYDYQYLKELIFTDTREPLQINNRIGANNSTYNSYNLTSVYYGRDLTGNPVKFTDAPNLESVIIGDKVTTIPDETFMNCKALTSCVMGDNVKHIGEKAFSGCEKLDILSIGESVETIGDNAYADCTGFSKIVARGVTPPAGMAGFGMEVEDNVPLYVPEESMEDYMNSDLFFPFANIESHTSNIVEEVEIDGDIDAEFTVGSQVRIPDWLRFIYHLVGHITGRHTPAKSKARAAEASSEMALRWFAPTPHVASVDQDGLVTVNAEGEFEIWAYVMDGSDKKVVISMGGEKTLKGDLNKDSILDSTDASMLVSHICDEENSTVTLKVGDINGDGVIDITDVNELVDIIKDNVNN